MFFAWQDDSKRLVADKLTAAIAAYQERYGRQPTAILMNETERTDAALTSFAGASVGSEPYVRRNNYYLGVGGA